MISLSFRRGVVRCLRGFSDCAFGQHRGVGFGATEPVFLLSTVGPRLGAGQHGL